MALRRRSFLAGLLACPACAAAARAEEGHHWSYEGTGGPAEWGTLDTSFKACGLGDQQSPIDLRDAIRASVDRLRISWPPQPFEIVNNGHTIQANAAPGGALATGGQQFTLAQFHFHTPSEHAVAGKRTAMEAHFVHTQPGGRIAVVGVLMAPGRRHEGFADIIRVAPRQEGHARLQKPLDPHTFLPQIKALYRYEGSLTTPPCSEVVDWFVLGDPIQVAQTDIDAFKGLFSMNARPLQPVNRRYLLRGS
jgi:carbonic anhydrase